MGRSSESSGSVHANRTIVSIAGALFRSFETTQVSSRRILKLIQIHYLYLNLSLSFYKWAVEERLKTALNSQQGNITSILSLMNVARMTRSSKDAKLKEIQCMEETCLEELGTLLASCTMRLLHVAEATASILAPYNRK